MKKAIKILAFLFIGYHAYGQSNYVEASFKDGQVALNNHLQQKFSEQVKGNDMNVCWISATFAKFTIDTVGNIKGISFYESDGTPHVFREILKTIIMTTNGRWSPATINGKAVESKAFILPLIYQMEAGCYSKGIVVKNGMDTALMALLNSTNSKEMQLDCVLLRPLNIFSIN